MTRPLSVQTAPLDRARSTATVVIYAAEGAAPAGAGGALWAATGLDWPSVAESAGFKGKQGQVLDLLSPHGLALKRLIVLGAGKASDAPPVLSAWADRGGSLAAKLTALGTFDAEIVLDEAGATPDAVAALVGGLTLRHYRFDKYKSRKPDDDADTTKGLSVTVAVTDPAAVDAAIADRMATVNGTLLARDLVNEPANVLGPLEFADKASELAALGVEVEIVLPEQLAALGMNSMLAVARGSRRPARMVIMRWNGGADGQAPLAFIGKGVVFDTGGISIKPAGSMEDMKGDMGGAAAVTGLMHTLASRKARVNAIGVIGLVENMPDGDAMRPGDIVKAMSGTTIEIINTDAEGRLVLADLLWYAQDRFKPQFMINLATLTGAIIVALGHDHAGLFCTSDDLSEKLLAAGLASNEKLWRMPLGPAYDKLIESRFADIKNSAGRPGSSITAAHFLKRFVNDVPWAHLDIAGTAFSAPATETNASWGSGFGVALLDRLVRDGYES